MSDSNPSPQKPLEIAFAVAEAGKLPESAKLESIPVGHQSEMPEGGVKIVQHRKISIGVFRVDGVFYAIRNSCPHQSAPLCLGRLHTTHAPGAVGEFKPALQGRALRCPWHGWEFDLITGKGLYDAKAQVKTYATHVDAEGNVFIDL